MLLHLQTFVSFFFFAIRSHFCDNHCMQQPCPEKKANICDPISIWNLNYCDSACVRANPISTTNRSVQVESHKIVSGEEIAPICTRMTLDSTRIQFVGLVIRLGVHRINSITDPDAHPLVAPHPRTCGFVHLDPNRPIGVVPDFWVGRYWSVLGKTVKRCHRRRRPKSRGSHGVEPRYPKRVEAFVARRSC